VRTLSDLQTKKQYGTSTYQSCCPILRILSCLSEAKIRNGGGNQMNERFTRWKERETTIRKMHDHGDDDDGDGGDDDSVLLFEECPIHYMRLSGPGTADTWIEIILQASTPVLVPTVSWKISNAVPFLY
jgi:hypothetical protein